MTWLVGAFHLKHAPTGVEGACFHLKQRHVATQAGLRSFAVEVVVLKSISSRREK